MYASRDFGAERRTLRISVIARGEADEEKKVRMAKIVLRCRCFVTKDMEAGTLAIVEYIEFVAFLDAVNEPVGCVCLGWATKNGEEKANEVGTSVKENDCTDAGD